MSKRRTERLLSIVVLLLSSRRYLTAEQIRAAVSGYPEEQESFKRMFERDKEELRDLGIPLETGRFDITVFNASLHYAIDLKAVLTEAARVTRSRGVLAVLDSPFYTRVADGEAMVAEKRAHGAAVFGARSGTLLSRNFIEYLTRERLAAAYPQHFWTRRIVRYPLWYELRPVLAALKRARRPSRFDLWTAQVP